MVAERFGRAVGSPTAHVAEWSTAEPPNRRTGARTAPSHRRIGEPPNRRTAERTAPSNRRTVVALRYSGSASEVGQPSPSGDKVSHALDALDQIIIAESEREPCKAGGTERLAGHKGHLCLAEYEVCKLEGAVGHLPGE